MIALGQTPCHKQSFTHLSPRPRLIASRTSTLTQANTNTLISYRHFVGVGISPFITLWAAVLTKPFPLPVAIVYKSGSQPRAASHEERAAIRLNTRLPKNCSSADSPRSRRKPTSQEPT